MIEVEHVQKRYGLTTVLADVSFRVGAGRHAALVGNNGTGKSTILRILAGQEMPDAGRVTFGPRVRVGYVPQDLGDVGDETMISYLSRVTGVGALDSTMRELEARLDDPEALQQYADASADFARVQGYAFMARVTDALRGLGMSDVPLDRPFNHLSGGQKSKVALAGVLLGSHDVVLLDEPTNNLDLHTLLWLEHVVQASPATMVIVSHDRRFLDRVADNIIELDWRTRSTRTSKGTYSTYLEEVSRQRALQQQQYDVQQERIAQLNDAADAVRRHAERGAKMVDEDKSRQGYLRDKASRSAKSAKRIEKRIEQLRTVEKPYVRDNLRVPFAPNDVRGNADIELIDVVAGYEGGHALGPVSLHIPFGARVGFVGRNGVGKSTLLNTLAGRLAPLSGRVRTGGAVRLSDLTQKHESLPRDETPLVYLEREGVGGTTAYRLLASLGIPAAQAQEPVSVLSPGARARMLIGTAAELGKNVLLLDEPTNHLDLEALEALETALTSFAGTLITVTHDRYFIDNIGITAMYEVIPNVGIRHISDWGAYIRQLERSAVTDIARR